MDERTKHIGRILLTQDLLLRFLDFTYGEVRDIHMCGDMFPRVIEITIEHGDMPEVKEDCEIPVVSPIYITHEDALGHKVTMRELLREKK